MKRAFKRCNRRVRAAQADSHVRAELRADDPIIQLRPIALALFFVLLYLVSSRQVDFFFDSFP